MKKYTLFGKNIVFDDAAEHAYEVQADYEFAKLRIRDLFRKWYKEQSSIQNVLNHFHDFVNSVYAELLVETTFEKIQKYGIYDMTADMYGRRCVSFEGAQDAFDEIEAQYDAITEKQHAEEQYRAARKASRGRWQGGGFGLSGALKGAATAGALNAVSGLGHDLANSAGNLSSALDASNAKSDLYNASATANRLLTGLYEDIRTFFDNHIQLMSTSKPGFFKFCFDEERAKALLGNAKQLPDKRTELLSQAFTLCPWDEDLQRYIFQRYPADRKEIFRASTEWGLGIYDCVEEVLSAEYTEKAKQNEADAQQAKKRILDIMHEYGLEESRALDQLETDCLNRLCPNIETTDEETCDAYITAIADYDAQETIKEQFIKRIEERVSAIWSTEDAAICRNIYMNTDLTSPDAVKKSLQKIKEKARTAAHEPYSKALEACSEANIGAARKYYHGVWPQVCGTLGWSGLAAFLLILFVWQLGAAWSILAAAVSIIFTVLYSSMKSAYNTLTLNGEVFHIAITRNNSAVAVQVPGILWTIPVVFLMLVAVYFVHPATDEIPAMPDSDTETDYADSAMDGSADEPAADTDGIGYITASYIYDYLGHWTVDMTNSASDASVSFDLESNNDILCFSAEAVWGQGDRVTKIGTTSLDMNEANTQAYGTYCDNLSNTGTVVLDFENGELYLTLVGNADHAWDISMQHEHCSRGQTDAPGALTDGVTQSIEQRLNDEAEFASMLQGQIIDRENWRSYEYLLLDTMADRNDDSSLSSVGTFEGTDSMTGVSVYQITQAEMEQWMQENYGADVADTQPDVAIYANGYYTAYGSQGFIGDTVSLLAAYELQSDTYYVQFRKQNKATMDDDGRGYAVVHFSDEYGVWQVWELGWDTEEASEQALAAYKN